MKKTLLALSVLAAGSAQAGINLYDANGVTVDLSGAVEVQYLQNIQDKNSDADAGLHLDDGDLQLNTTIAVNEQLNVVAGIGFAFEKRDVSNDELWAGLSGDFGTLTFGRMLYISDDAGIGKDYELGFGQVDFVQTEGNEVIKYVFDNGQFYFGLSHDLDTDGSGASDYQNTDGTVTDVRLGARFADLDVRGYYYTGDDIQRSADQNGNPIFNSGTDVDAFNLEAEYVMGQFAFAASYGNFDYSNANGATYSDIDVIEVNGAYTLGKNTFALGYNRADDSKQDVVTDNVYANVTHQLHSNVKVYGELGWADQDGSDLDLGYLVGMEVKF
ncbi:porin [Photobacterium aphoticum]|uniref:Porin n=1 Tax=Photobacterium aphoticum TaxID=754436 RepID=A0A0J1GKN2_9GAMM|nr:porin [Photobacterium aphoticum]KLV00029.1 porin [Photobacterium aphoticum]PSU58544.1 porin [Photobacterium aphoticum]GHA48257.1 membrane protein [Photobacterium aphoticum]